MYACLDVDVVVGGFEKRHFNFVPGVARASATGLRLCKLSDDVGRRPLGPGDSFPRQQLAQLCFCHFPCQCGEFAGSVAQNRRLGQPPRRRGADPTRTSLATCVGSSLRSTQPTCCRPGVRRPGAHISPAPVAKSRLCPQDVALVAAAPTCKGRHHASSCACVHHDGLSCECSRACGGRRAEDNGSSRKVGAARSGGPADRPKQVLIALLAAKFAQQRAGRDDEHTLRQADVPQHRPRPAARLLPISSVRTVGWVEGSEDPTRTSVATCVESVLGSTQPTCSTCTRLLFTSACSPSRTCADGAPPMELDPSPLSMGRKSSAHSPPALPFPLPRHRDAARCHPA
jgi:hypothetical protein